MYNLYIRLLCSLTRSFVYKEHSYKEPLVEFPDFIVVTVTSRVPCIRIYVVKSQLVDQNQAFLIHETACNSMRDCIFQCSPAWCQCSPAWSKSVVMGLRSGFTRVALGFALPRINFHHSWLFELTHRHSWWKLILGIANPGAALVTWP